MSDEVFEDWLPLPGWGGSYEVERLTGRCRSIDRYVVSVTGQCRFLRGGELRRCGRAAVVTLSCRGHRRSFTPEALAQLVAES